MSHGYNKYLITAFLVHFCVIPGLFGLALGILVQQVHLPKIWTMASARPNMRDTLSKFTKAYNWVEISIRYMYHQVSWAPRLRNFFQIIVSKGQFKPRLFQGPVAWVCYWIGGSIPYIECKIFQASIYYRLLSLHDIETEAQHSLVLVSGPWKDFIVQTYSQLYLTYITTVHLLYTMSSLTSQSVVKLCFYERKLQVQESEKYEEWKNNRPADRILEIGTLLNM